MSGLLTTETDITASDVNASRDKFGENYLFLFVHFDLWLAFKKAGHFMF